MALIIVFIPLVIFVFFVKSRKYFLSFSLSYCLALAVIHYFTVEPHAHNPFGEYSAAILLTIFVVPIICVVAFFKKTSKAKDNIN